MTFVARVPRARDPRRTFARAHRRWPLLVLCAAAPFVLAYALVPLQASRDPVLSWGGVHDARSFVELLTRSDYGGLFSAVHGPGHGSASDRLAALARSGGLLLAGSALRALLRRARAPWTSSAAHRLSAQRSSLATLASGPLFACSNALGTHPRGVPRLLRALHDDVRRPRRDRLRRRRRRRRESSFPSGAARVTASVALAAWVAPRLSSRRPGSTSERCRGIAFAHDLVLRDARPRARTSLRRRRGERRALRLRGRAPLRRARSRSHRGASSSHGRWRKPAAATRSRDIPGRAVPALKRPTSSRPPTSPSVPSSSTPTSIEKDPLLAESSRPLPDGLLFRLWPVRRPTRRRSRTEAETTSLPAHARLSATVRSRAKGAASPSRRTTRARRSSSLAPTKPRPSTMRAPRPASPKRNGLVPRPPRPGGGLRSARRRIDVAESSSSSR